ncbi:type I-F CRISPR-associated protein Csy1 [Limisalsivibrio acetivorans]|uniref:type I-F CRISPR-associated protein Csy1 n=1 Tax=Limisalsivibrio acetivorans TaxID=1304888 RepID=UPI0003B52506|nr:type I-F CRISPR-associated protein Csy1 [Limisalsivibrio acetivorans]
MRDDPDKDSLPKDETVSGVIEAFLLEKKEKELKPEKKKLESEDDFEKRVKILEKIDKINEKFTLENWLENAAKGVEPDRLSSLRLVTHAPKYTHKDAKATGVFLQNPLYSSDELVGTHSLNEKPLDCMGNAAYLGTFPLYRSTVNGVPIYELFMRKDPELLNALSDDPEKSEELYKAFYQALNIGEPYADTLLKQLYFPVGYSYHLLTPLYPSVVVHYVHRCMSDIRFSKEIKEIRDLKSKNKPHSCGYRYYPDLALQGVGGSKPQNASQLNSQRGGQGYLLPSLPPKWVSKDTKPILYIEDPIEKVFSKRKDVWSQFKGYLRILKRYEDRTNLEIREMSSKYREALLDELTLFTFEMRQLEPGWSNDENCRLNQSFRLWLDSGMEVGNLDEEYQNIDWVEDVATAYVKWFTRTFDKEAKKAKYEKPLGDEDIVQVRKEAAEVLKDLARGFDNE